MYVLDLVVDDNLVYSAIYGSLRDIIYFARSMVRKYARLNEYRHYKYSEIFAYIYEPETIDIDYVIGAIFADKYYSVFRCSDKKLAVIRR